VKSFPKFWQKYLFKGGNFVGKHGGSYFGNHMRQQRQFFRLDEAAELTFTQKKT